MENQKVMFGHSFIEDMKQIERQQLAFWAAVLDREMCKSQERVVGQFLDKFQRKD